MSDGKRFYMDHRVVWRLEQVIAEQRAILEHWDTLAEGDRRERLAASTELLANIATPAKNWRLLAEANGIELPDGPEAEE